MIGRISGAIVLGIIQGASEFLPISSSGHLVIGSVLFHLAPPSLFLDVILHLGTLVPILWLYRGNLKQLISSLLPARDPIDRPSRSASHQMIRALIVATIPTASVGLLFRHDFESLFANVSAVSAMFILTGTILWLPRLYEYLNRPRHLVPQGEKHDKDTIYPEPTARQAFTIGLAQSIAITPGISRSGMTISTGMLAGLDREMSARFSFLLSIPAIIGAAILHIPDISTTTELSAPALGAISAAVAGYIALRIVLTIVRRSALHHFSYYLWTVGTILLLYR